MKFHENVGIQNYDFINEEINNVFEIINHSILVGDFSIID